MQRTRLAVSSFLIRWVYSVSSTIQPSLNQHCMNRHYGEIKNGDLDLSVAPVTSGYASGQGHPLRCTWRLTF
jgi:hypothetical protein